MCFATPKYVLLSEVVIVWLSKDRELRVRSVTTMLVFGLLRDNIISGGEILRLVQLFGRVLKPQTYVGPNPF